MIRKSNSFLKILFSSICLASGSAMAAPITDLGKQIVSEKPGSILSLEQQAVTDLFPHADQRLLVNYRRIKWRFWCVEKGCAVLR